MAHYIFHQIQFIDSVFTQFYNFCLTVIVVLILIFNMAAPLYDPNFVNHYPEEFHAFLKMYVQMVKTNNKYSNIKPHCGLR